MPSTLDLTFPRVVVRKDVYSEGTRWSHKGENLLKDTTRHIYLEVSLKLMVLNFLFLKSV